MNLLTSTLFLAAVIAGEVLGREFHSPTALPVVLHNGYLADTQEVAAARSAHLVTLSHQSHEHHGHSALPLVLHDGHIADTHEVAAAKAEHFAAVAEARVHGGYNHRDEYTSGYHQKSGGSGSYTHSSYHGPIAMPVVLHDGHIADTHEVAAAKAEHFAAVAKARIHKEDHENVQFTSENDYHGHSSHASYHGPTAKPLVLPSGYLADTHEVAHAKNHHLHLLRSSQSRH